MVVPVVKFAYVVWVARLPAFRPCVKVGRVSAVIRSSVGYRGGVSGAAFAIRGGRGPALVLRSGNHDFQD